MKIIYRESKYLRHSKSIAKSRLKRRIKKIRKEKNFRRTAQGVPSLKLHEWKVNRTIYKSNVWAPANLSFLNDPETVVGFLKQLEDILEKKKSLFVEMRSVENIDYPSIALLFAILFRSAKVGVRINGSFPDNTTAREILNKSGFVYTLFKKNIEDLHRYDINADNQLFTLDKRDLIVVREIEEGVSKCIGNKGQRLHGLYTALGELVDNTITHASNKIDRTERWWLSINYNREFKKAEFVFVDYGVGIFTSLAGKEEHPVKRVFEKAIKLFGMDAADQHLKAIVTKSARKYYGLKKGRGQGIYGIREALERQDVKNLHIASNNAFGNVSTVTYKKLTKTLNGTLYYWEIHGNNK